MLSNHVESWWWVDVLPGSVGMMQVGVVPTETNLLETLGTSSYVAYVVVAETCATSAPMVAVVSRDKTCGVVVAW